jgi:WD40 repeat protein
MKKFDSHVDSLSLSGPYLVAGLSNLEGNIWDGHVKVISVETGVELSSLHLPCGTPCVRHLYHGDTASGGGAVIVGRDDGVISLVTMDPNQNQLLSEVERFDVHDDIVSTVCPHKLQPGKFYSASWDGSINLWDCQATASKGKSHRKGLPVVSLRNAHYGHINDITMCANTQAASDHVLASVGDDGFLRLWDQRAVAQSTSAAVCSQLVGVGQAVTCVHWTDTHQVFVGTDGGDICGFDLRNLQENASTVRAHQKRVRRLAGLATESGNMMFSGSDDKTVGVFSVGNDSASPTVSQLARLSPHTDFVADLCAVTDHSEDGSSNITIFSASTDKTICMSVYSA